MQGIKITKKKKKLPNHDVASRLDSVHQACPQFRLIQYVFCQDAFATFVKIVNVQYLSDAFSAPRQRACISLPKPID